MKKIHYFYNESIGVQLGLVVIIVPRKWCLTLIKALPLGAKLLPLYISLVALHTSRWKNWGKFHFQRAKDYPGRDSLKLHSTASSMIRCRSNKSCFFPSICETITLVVALICRELYKERESNNLPGMKRVARFYVDIIFYRGRLKRTRRYWQCYNRVESLLSAAAGSGWWHTLIDTRERFRGKAEIILHLNYSANH